MSQDDGLDGLRKLAEAGVIVLGSDEAILHHDCRRGTWTFLGGLSALGATAGAGIEWWWAIVLLLVLGYLVNEHESRTIRADIKRRRARTVWNNAHRQLHQKLC